MYSTLQALDGLINTKRLNLLIRLEKKDKEKKNGRRKGLFMLFVCVCVLTPSSSLQPRPSLFLSRLPPSCCLSGTLLGALMLRSSVTSSKSASIEAADEGDVGDEGAADSPLLSLLEGEEHGEEDKAALFGLLPLGARTAAAQGVAQREGVGMRNR
jgi:hypothetical protein